MFIRQLCRSKTVIALRGASSVELRPRCHLDPAATSKPGRRLVATATAPSVEQQQQEQQRSVETPERDRKDSRTSGQDEESNTARNERKHARSQYAGYRGDRSERKGHRDEKDERTERTEQEGGGRGPRPVPVPGTQDAKSAYQKTLKWTVRKQLQHMTESYRIGEHVRATLDRGRLDEAMLLAQEASRTAKVTVSWNYIIAYLLKEQRIHAAIKCFNDMKKRAQLPSAHTYTVMFRGLAESQHPKLAVSEALRIYNIVRQDERVRLNIIHLNAVLEVCGRAGDLDSMFRVLDEATDRRSGQRFLTPDARTYTIVLNALHFREGPSKRAGLPEEQIREGVETSIRRGKAIWDEVVRRWRKGQLVMDEPLVCAMGRVLLPGSRRDNEDILALLEQTMQLPRFDLGKGQLGKGADTQAPPETALLEEEDTEPLAEDTQGSIQDWTEDHAPDPEQQQSPINRSSPTAIEENAPEDDDVVSETPVAPTLPPSVQEPSREFRAAAQRSHVLFARPGTNTLSLIMASLANTRRTSLGPQYWDLLTTTYGVVPDKDNHHRYLRVLRNGRASARAAALVRAMPREHVTDKALRLALSACVADNLNAHAFGHARAVLAVLTETQRYADPLALRIFLQAATGNHRRFREQEQRGDAAGARIALGRQLLAALDDMWAPFHVLAGSLSFPRPDRPAPTRSPDEAWARTAASRQEVVATARRMVATLDKVIGEGMAESPDVLALARKRRASLQSYIVRYYEKDGEMGRRAVAAAVAGAGPNATAAKPRRGEATRADAEMEQMEEWDVEDGDKARDVR